MCSIYSVPVFVCVCVCVTLRNTWKWFFFVLLQMLFNGTVKNILLFFGKWIPFNNRSEKMMNENEKEWNQRTWRFVWVCNPFPLGVFITKIIIRNCQNIYSNLFHHRVDEIWIFIGFFEHTKKKYLNAGHFLNRQN